VCVCVCAYGIEEGKWSNVSDVYIGNILGARYVGVCGGKVLYETICTNASVILSGMGRTSRLRAMEETL
jgi:hypothetical protein